MVPQVAQPISSTLGHYEQKVVSQKDSKSQAFVEKVLLIIVSVSGQDSVAKNKSEKRDLAPLPEQTVKQTTVLELLAPRRFGQGMLFPKIKRA